MKKTIAYVVLAVAVFGGAPVYAETSVGSDRPFSVIQFSDLSQNRGLSGRALDRKYEEYRQGRAPRTTLSTSSIR